MTKWIQSVEVQCSEAPVHKDIPKYEIILITIVQKKSKSMQMFVDVWIIEGGHINAC